MVFKASFAFKVLLSLVSTDSFAAQRGDIITIP